MFRRILARRIGKTTQSKFIDVGEIVYDGDRRVLGVGNGDAEPARMLGENSNQTVTNKEIDGDKNTFLNNPPVATIIIYPTNNSAVNYLGPKWTQADGKLLNRNEYSTLFNIIGTSFSAGNGTTTFGVPFFTQISSNLAHFIKIKP